MTIFRIPNRDRFFVTGLMLGLSITMTSRGWRRSDR